MSRLLVIEPNLMMRYGLAVALIPDHLAQFVDALPAAPALESVDGIIVDAAMLRQGARLTEVDLQAVDSWKVPTVWIDDLEPVSTPERVNWVTLKMPVQRERLLKAVFDCVNPASPSTAAAKRVESRTALPAKTRAKKTKAAVSPAAGGADVIELVEVVDDEPENG
jgi:hypothetical protein